MKKKTIWSLIYIFACTAHIFEEQLNLCLSAGMNKQLLKPIKMKTLKEAIETVVKRTTPNLQPQTE